MDKDQRRALADATLKIIDDRYYRTPSDGAVNLKVGISCAINGTRYFEHGALDRKTVIRVTNQTTLEAARELVVTGRDVGVLNFASAKNPGGGFLRGTQAQEESLARSSALYACLTTDAAKKYYVAHKCNPAPMYSDRMIFSPEVPVFRDDAGNLLDKPYYVHILTCAAPNLRALEEQNKDFDDYELIEDTFDRRIRNILRVFYHYDCRILVLGAWGCGVFGNHPNTVAEAFSARLQPAAVGQPRGEFNGCFEHVRFAIPDKNGANHQAFRTWFDLDDGTDSVTW